MPSAKAVKMALSRCIRCYLASAIVLLLYHELRVCRLVTPHFSRWHIVFRRFFFCLGVSRGVRHERPQDQQREVRESVPPVLGTGTEREGEGEKTGKEEVAGRNASTQEGPRGKKGAGYTGVLLREVALGEGCIADLNLSFDV